MTPFPAARRRMTGLVVAVAALALAGSCLPGLGGIGIEGEGEGGTEGEGEIYEELVVVDVVAGVATAERVLDPPFGVQFDGDATVTAADVDADGNVDAVISGGTRVVIIRDVFGARTVQTIDGPLGDNFVGQTAAGDVDGDGDIDLVVAGESRTPLVVLENDGAGTFAAPRVVEAIDATEAGPGIGCEGAGAGGAVTCDLQLRGVVLDDVDGDGDLDIVAAGEAAGVWTNDGAGVFARTAFLGQIDVDNGAARVERLVVGPGGGLAGVGDYYVTLQGAHGDTSVVAFDVAADHIAVAHSFRADGGRLLQHDDDAGAGGGGDGNGGWLVCDGRIVHVDEALTNATAVAGPGCGELLVDLDGDAALELVGPGGVAHLDGATLTPVDGNLHAGPEGLFAPIASTRGDGDVVALALRRSDLF